MHRNSYDQLPNAGRYTFRVFRGRLAQFSTFQEGIHGWEEKWSRHSVASILKKHSAGDLDEFEDIFTRFLPKDLPILEAGCGLGQWVMALTSRGYRIEGIDNAEETVRGVKDAAPQLTVRLGNVYSLDVPDRSYGGYISLGVFEHKPEGPLAGLKEASRVLQPGGIACISVPYLNRERRNWLRCLPEATGTTLPNGLRFYQYYFSLEDFQSFLRQAQLETLAMFPYAVSAGLTRDFWLGRWLHSHHFFSWRLKSGFFRRCARAPFWARWRWGHMLLFVCRRMEYEKKDTGRKGLP